MNCKEYQHQITLLLYEELLESARVELEMHLNECRNCHDAYESEKTMHSVLAEDASQWDIPSDLLVESRRGLADELDRIERKRSWWRMPTFSVVFTPMRLLESVALIAMGLALGVYVSNQRQIPSPVAGNSGQDQISVIPRNGTISNLQVVNADPVTGQVELSGEVSQPLRFQGKMDDDTIRNLLFSALRDANNPGSRLKAVEVLSQKPTNEPVEEALINALVYDDDAGVRMRALEALRKFADEQHVRIAFMHALKNDEIVGIRIGAIDALTASKSKDQALAKSLQEVTKNEDSPYIRSRVLQFVGTSK
ncbi:MAG TPA: HEAT repeat domain-containing protein [Terriglobia bacterium]|nr:HEAT repeat domain-containing protein [Terriglobia bacterium]